MGAWTFVEPYLEWVLGQVGGKSKRPRYAGRPASAATATGLDVEASGAAEGVPRRMLRLSERSPTMPYFLCKLIPPRTTFLADMTRGGARRSMLRASGLLAPQVNAGAGDRDGAGRRSRRAPTASRSSMRPR